MNHLLPPSRPNANTVSPQTIHAHLLLLLALVITTFIGCESPPTASYSQVGGPGTKTVRVHLHTAIVFERSGEILMAPSLPPVTKINGNSIGPRDWLFPFVIDVPQGQVKLTVDATLAGGRPLEFNSSIGQSKRVTSVTVADSKDLALGYPFGRIRSGAGTPQEFAFDIPAGLEPAFVFDFMFVPTSRKREISTHPGEVRELIQGTITGWRVRLKKNFLIGNETLQQFGPFSVTDSVPPERASPSP